MPPSGSRKQAKRLPKRAKRLPRDANSHPEAPNSHQDGPHKVPRRPQEAPSGAQVAQAGPKRPPRKRQEPPRGPQDGPRRSQDSPKRRPEPKPLKKHHTVSIFYKTIKKQPYCQHFLALGAQRAHSRGRPKNVANGQYLNGLGTHQGTFPLRF